MTTSHHAVFDIIIQSNQDLLELTRQEKWDEFNVLAETYIIALHDFVEVQSHNMTQEERESFNECWQVLLKNEAEMVTKLNGRLNVLKKEMSSLRQGSKFSKAYSSQMLAGFH